MSVSQAIDQLKHNVLILRGVRSIQSVARDMKVENITLRNWLRGGGNTTEKTLAKIEAWVKQQEEAQGAYTVIHRPSLDHA